MRIESTLSIVLFHVPVFIQGIYLPFYKQNPEPTFLPSMSKRLTKLAASVHTSGLPAHRCSINRTPSFAAGTRPGPSISRALGLFGSAPTW